MDSWIADPYSIYARKILKLRQLDDLDRPPMPYYVAICYDALAIFIDRYPSGFLYGYGLAELAIGKDVFTSQWRNPVCVFWWPRFMAVAAVCFGNRSDVGRSGKVTPVKGEIAIDGPEGPVHSQRAPTVSIG